MKTIEINLYKFEELTEEGQQNAIDQYLNNHNDDHCFIWDEARATAEAFLDHFPVKFSPSSWLEYIPTWEADIDDLKGLRLRTYIINNFGYILFKGKYYGKLINTFKDGSKIAVSKEHPAGLRHVIRYSKCQFERNCNLTGMAYDEDMLDPIYDFLEYKNDPNDTTFEELLDDCFNSLKSTVEKEIEYRQTEDFAREELTETDHDFTEEGYEY